MTTMTRRDRWIAAGFAAVIAAAVAMAVSAGGADAATYGNGFQVAKFKVEIEGRQTTILKHTHEAAAECDTSDFSTGRELVRFKSKPIVVTAVHTKGEPNPEFFAGRRLGIPARAIVERSFTPVIHAPANPACGENGGGVENVTQPDCGRKVVNPWPLKLEYSPERDARDKLLLTTETTEDPFHECEGAGPAGFPYLNVLGEHGDLVGARLSQDQLFDPGYRKWISLASGAEKTETTDYFTRTKTEWSVSFTRLVDK